MNYKQETMNNNAVDETPGMRAAERTAMLDTIYNDTTARNTDTTVDMEITGLDIKNIGVQVEITGVGTKTPGVQDTSHEDNNNED